MKSGSVNAEILKDSRFLKDTEFIDTGYPLINLALSGSFDKGLGPGITMFAGPSKHFKSNYLCVCMAAYLKQKEDSVVLFYDTEFGTKKEYFESFGISADRVIHIPIQDIEELSFDMVKRVKDIELGDNVLIAVDSFGNVPSKKEVENAENENSAQDMTRAKQLKSLGRIITPRLAVKNIPMVGVNHTYETQEMYSKQIMSGGKGLEYSSDTIAFVGKRQIKEKSDKKPSGYEFVLRLNKSRYVIEGSEFPISVTYAGGINKYSGILDLALDNGFLVQAGAWVEYQGTKFRRKELESSSEIMEELLNNEEFVNAVETKYKIPSINSPTVDLDTGYDDEDDDDEFMNELKEELEK